MSAAQVTAPTHAVALEHDAPAASVVGWLDAWPVGRCVGQAGSIGTNRFGVQSGPVSDGTPNAPSARVPILRRLLSESAVYGLGGVANQALGIILVPIYARQLGSEGYGTVALLTTTLSTATLIATLAMPQAFFRAYLREASGDDARRGVLATTLGLRLVASVAALILLLALAAPLAGLILGNAGDWVLMAVIGVVVLFDTLNIVPLSYLRAERRPLPYAVLGFGRALAGGVLIVGLVVVGDLGPLGVVLGSAAAALLAAAAGYMLLGRIGRLRMAFDRTLVRRMLAFGLPLVPASLAGWALNLSDRYLVNAFDGREAVGIYAAGYTVGLALNALVIAPFGLAWGAAYWEIARRDDAPRVISRVLTGFAALASFIALGLSALATDAFRILLTPEFEPGRFVTPFSAFGLVGLGIFTILTTGINLAGRTRRLPLIMGSAALANIGLNLVLIPSVGYLGAAASSLLSYWLLAAIGGFSSHRVYPVAWEVGRVALAVGIGMALAAASVIGPDHVAWRLACIAAYPALVIGFGIVPRRYASELIGLVRPR